MPAEFNSWLLFRNIVDLILVNDFVAYVLFVFANSQWTPLGEWTMLDVLRYASGLMLMAFNYWVKADAHRVVKDYAWVCFVEKVVGVWFQLWLVVVLGRLLFPY